MPEGRQSAEVMYFFAKTSSIQQVELDSHIFKPWDVFIYLVDEWVILAESIQIRQKRKSQPGFSLNS